MIPCVILACKGTRARVSGQRILMALGGRYGFHWQQNPMPTGGAVFTVTDAPAHAEKAVRHALDAHMGEQDDWMVNGWRQRTTEEQMVRAESWWAGRPYSPRPRPHHEARAD